MQKLRLRKETLRNLTFQEGVAIQGGAVAFAKASGPTAGGCGTTICTGTCFACSLFCSAGPCTIICTPTTGTLAAVGGTLQVDIRAHI